jgi:hypothetical protein
MNRADEIHDLADRVHEHRRHLTGVNPAVGAQLDQQDSTIRTVIADYGVDLNDPVQVRAAVAGCLYASFVLSTFQVCAHSVPVVDYAMRGARDQLAAFLPERTGL